MDDVLRQTELEPNGATDVTTDAPAAPELLPEPIPLIVEPTLGPWPEPPAPAGLDHPDFDHPGAALGLVGGRRRNWEILLVRFAEGARGRPYVWGETDCIRLTLRGIALMYGTDRFIDLPPWRSALAAVRVLRAVGSVEAELARDGWRELAPGFAYAGDVLVGRVPDHPGFPLMALVVDAVHALVADHESQLVEVVALRDLLAAFPGATVWRLDYHVGPVSAAEPTDTEPRDG